MDIHKNDLLVRLSSSFVVALIPSRACGWRIFVKLVFLDQWLDWSARFVQINFKIVRFVLEIFELFFNQLNFVFFVSYGRF